MLDLAFSLVPVTVPDTIAKSHAEGEPFARYFGGALAPILALTVLHLVLRLMSRAGWIRYGGGGLTSALSGAVLAMNAIFQPHAGDPMAGRTPVVRVQSNGEPPLPRGPTLPDEATFPDDGLRGTK